jgi:hypothetical protein
MAVTIDDLVGTWDMCHDGWQGVLTINPAQQPSNVKDQKCEYQTWIINGSYTGADGSSHTVEGNFQGLDPNVQTDQPCPTSEHFVVFTISFEAEAGTPPQQFEGYIFTQQKGQMAGCTWWHGLPFGWFAKKR